MQFKLKKLKNFQVEKFDICQGGSNEYGLSMFWIKN